MNTANINDLLGSTLANIEGMEKGSQLVIFETTGGDKFAMSHDQDCSEHVRLEDVIGDPDDLIGPTILMAEESTNRGYTDEHLAQGSYTWTFYKLATVRGYVTLRWLGESNGYYSERVDFERIA